MFRRPSPSPALAPVAAGSVPRGPPPPASPSTGSVGSWRVSASSPRASSLSVWTCQRPVHPLEIERLRIKRSPGPLEQFVVPRVAGVPDCREELLVSGHTAAVLGRASTLAPQADGNAAAFTRGEDPLDEDLVRPVVTEVVPVEEGVLSAVATSQSLTRCSGRMTVGPRSGSGIPYRRPAMTNSWRWLLVQPMACWRTRCRRLSVREPGT